ncbi:MAG: hypothetical protein SOZ34_07915 [Clostridia bacterium]|nr:hypothetical protein [Clostridia bacterium]
MKKQISVFAALCMAVSAAGGMVSVSAEDTTNTFNEFITYSFEDDYIGNMGGQNGPVIEVAENGGYLGTKGLKLDVSAVTSSIAGIRIGGCDAVGGSEYKLTAKVKLAESPTGKISWRLYNWDKDEAGNEINSSMAYKECAYKDIGDGWYSVEGSAVYPGNDSTSLMLDIRLNERQIVGSANPVYMDDISLIPVKADFAYGQPQVLEWNAGENTLSFGKFNNGVVGEPSEEGVRVTSTGYNQGVIVNKLSNGVTLAQENQYKIEMIAKLESGAFSTTNFKLPYGTKVPDIELIDETESLYKITSQTFTGASVWSGQFDKDRFYFGFADSSATILIKQIKFTNLGKTFAPEQQEINTYAYTVDTNNEYAYGIVDKEFTVATTTEPEETTEGTTEGTTEETTTVTRAVVQQFNLDGTATGKYFDITTLDERYEFATKYDKNYQLVMSAENGIVTARPSKGIKLSNGEYVEDTNPISICIMDFNGDTVTGKVNYFASSGNGNSMYHTHGFTFVAWGSTLAVYNDSTGYRMGNAYTMSVSDIYNMYVDWDGENSGKIYVASRCYGNNSTITDNSKIVIVDFDLDDAKRPQLVYDANAPENNSKETVINLKTELAGVTGYFNPAQMFVMNDKLYVVSKSTGFVTSEEYLLVFELSTETPRFEKKLTVKDFNSSSNETITGIAPCGDYLAVFTTAGRRVLDSFASNSNNLYLIDAESHTWDSENNPKITLNARAHMTGFTDKYVYAAKAKQDANANSNLGSILFERFEKSKKVTAPEIDTTGIISDNAVFTVPDLSGASEYSYKILASADNSNWVILQNGITNAAQLTYKLTDKLSDKYLKLEVVYNDESYSYGIAKAADKIFGLKAALPENFSECVRPSVEVLGTVPSGYNGSFKVVLAFYATNENNASELVGTSVFDYDASTGVLSGEDAQIPENADNCAAFLWNDLQTIRPYSPKATAVKATVTEE